MANDVIRPRIDLYSDTRTRPTAAMRQAIAAAEVGDEQAEEDPTVNLLCRMSAELLGKDSAIFLPSGTMCNEIAYRVWCDRGDEIILDKSSHGLHFEVGAPAALSGAMTRTLDGERGIFTGAMVAAALRPKTRHAPRSALVSIENTANLGGGAVWPLARVQEVGEVAKAHGLRLHMDGARLMNAVVASGIAACDYAAPCDSVWLDLSKGLGCPVGAVLAGSEEFIERAWRFKHQFGGAMRQAGIIAAAGVYALRHHIDRLAEDHANAARLAKGLSEFPGVRLLHDPIETNMVYFDPSGTGIEAPEFARRLATHSVRIGAMGRATMRAVTHLDVDASMIDETLEAVRRVAAKRRAGIH